MRVPMPRRRLFYNTNGLAHHRLDDAIDLIADLGYDGLALTPDVQHLDPFRATSRDVERTAVHLAKRGLAVSIQTGARFILDAWRKHQPTLLDPDPAMREVRREFLVRCLDIGRDLGAGVLSFWSGAVPHAGTAETMDAIDARLIAGCEGIAAAAALRGLRAALEPEPGMHVETVAQFDRVRARVTEAHFGLAFDVGHAHCSGEGDPVRIIREHAGDLLDVQVEDMRVGEHLHLPFGEGTLDVGPSLRALDAAGYDGAIVVELSRDSHRAIEVATAALRHLRSLEG